MAFVTAQTNVIRQAGYIPALLVITGTYLNTAGDTGGIISPGYSNASGTLTAYTDASIGGRKIVSAVLTPTLSDATAPGGAVAYNLTRDRDEFTIVTTANTGGTYKIECLDNGA